MIALLQTSSATSSVSASSSLTATAIPASGYVCAFMTGALLHDSPHSSLHAQGYHRHLMRACVLIPLCFLSSSAGPPGFPVERGGYCYAAIFKAGGISWNEAQAQCNALGGVRANLATIRDAGQKIEVMDNRCAGLVPQGYYWHIGMHDQHSEGTFQFTSGYNASFARNSGFFCPGEVRGVVTWLSVLHSVSSFCRRKCLMQLIWLPPSFSCVQPNNDGGGFEDCVHIWTNGCLNDYICTQTGVTTSTGTGVVPFAGCCEVPSVASSKLLCNSCPSGFSSPDATGFCYAGLDGSFTWDAALKACRALSPAASLAGVYDQTTAMSVVTNRCAGLMAGKDFHIGLRDNDPTGYPHTSPTGSYWRWMGSGSVNNYITTTGTSYWASGERESHVSLHRCALSYVLCISIALSDGRRQPEPPARHIACGTPVGPQPLGVLSYSAISLFCSQRQQLIR